MAIRRADRTRLARLAGPRVWAERHAVEERVELRDRLSFCLLVAILLDIEEVDPESTCVMRRYREAEAELAAIPDTPELEEADDAYLARLDTRWIDDWQPKRRYQPVRVEEPIEREIERLMMRYRTDLKDVDLTKRSPFELFAWCLSRHGATYDEAADKAGKAAQDLLLLIDQLPDDPTPEDIEDMLLAWENQ